MDYIRRPYSTLARFFADDEGPPVIIQWYAAAADAPTLGRGTSFMSLDWTSETSAVQNPNWPDEPWLQRPGEIFEAKRPFSPWPTPLGLDYAHVCGTDAEFIDGVTFDPDRDVKYDEQGLPLCCNGPIVPVFPLVIEFEADLPEAPPAPGVDCTGAIELDVGVWYEVTLPQSFGFYTWRWDDVPLFGNIRFRCTTLNAFVPAAVGAQLFRGGACNAFAPEIGTFFPGFLDETRLGQVFAPATTFLVNQSVTPVTFLFRLDVLP